MRSGPAESKHHGALHFKKPTLHNISGCNAIPLCNLEFFAPGVCFKSWFQNLTLSQFKPVGDFSISIRIGSGNATRKLPPRRGWSFCSALPHHLHLLPQHIFVWLPLLQPTPPPATSPTFGLPSNHFCFTLIKEERMEGG